MARDGGLPMTGPVKIDVDRPKGISVSFSKGAKPPPKTRHRQLTSLTGVSAGRWSDPDGKESPEAAQESRKAESKHRRQGATSLPRAFSVACQICPPNMGGLTAR
jgi:hypothetical protein